MQTKLIKEILKLKKISYKKVRKILSRYPKNVNKMYSKSDVLEKYRDLLKRKVISRNAKLEKFLKTKPTRTISGVVPVTVLTKPYKCRGNCIFCPTRADQPKSYLSSEPGAQRAKMLAFDPYRQVKVRIQALKNIGHNTDKIELIILGGTWSDYPKKYQVWFVKECFRALNDLGDQTGQDDQCGETKSDRFDRFDQLKRLLVTEQKRNSTAKHRNVGLVVETRPDAIDEKHVKWLRFLGATKVQLGVQTLNSKILKKNNRGHTLRDTRNAIKLLRLAGFKLHIHWMSNLYGSSLEEDFIDFQKLFNDESICPDELKIYPCILLEDTKLYELYKEGKYKPYTFKQLVNLLVKCKKIVPNYCRISRLFRDIPSFEIVSGVKKTNLREYVQEEMRKRGVVCNCIRCREIRSANLQSSIYNLQIYKYETNVTEEHFVSYNSENDKILGFLRLSLPNRRNFIHEIQDCAMIREVHVYGTAKQIKAKQPIPSSQQPIAKNGPQHQGLGTKLIAEAERIAMMKGFKQIAVISAIGTREYYRKRGYELGKLYMTKKL
jgi:elongator complex protein 3